MYKLLAFKPDAIFSNSDNPNKYALKLNIPDTLVFNDSSKIPPFWLYTSLDGYVQKIETFSE